MECGCITAFSRLFCSMSRFLIRFRWHFLFWIAYFIGWTWLSVSTYHTPVAIAGLVTLTWFIGQATMIYTTVYYWMPRYLRPRRLGWFFTALVASILSSAVFTALISYALLKAFVPAFSYSFTANFVYVVMGNVYWAILAIGGKIFRDRLRNDRRNQRLEKEHAENELRFLKSQMNPHFLFNAINSIYVLIRKDPALAEHTLASFSDMLRYQLYDCATDYIPIEKEISYLENYIRLEQLRKGPALTIDYEIGPAVTDFSIAPLLLMPLVENAFKFVSSYPDRDNQVRIRLSFHQPVFHFEIVNTVDEPATTTATTATTIPHPRTPDAAPRTERSPGGIGLDNVRRRLELLYPNKHQLQITPAPDYYTVSLKLQVV